MAAQMVIRQGYTEIDAMYGGYECRTNSIPIRELEPIPNSFAEQLRKAMQETVNQEFNQPTKIKEDMQMKKYVFTISYEEKVNNKTEIKYGTLSLWANDLIHANDLFKKLYCYDGCGSLKQPSLNVTSVYEQPDLV